MAATWTRLGASSVRSVQAKTEAAPVADTDGMNLSGVSGVTLWLDAGDGETINAETGQVDIYVFDSGLWGVAILLTLSVPPGAAGLRRVQLGTVPIDNPRGRLAPIANGIGATGSTVIIEALATVHNIVAPVAA